jgi:hypothetical protein
MCWQKQTQVLLLLTQIAQLIQLRSWLLLLVVLTQAQQLL